MTDLTPAPGRAKWAAPAGTLLSERPEHLQAARALVREYLLLPDVWERFGGVPTQLPGAFERELRLFPGAAAPPGGEGAISMEGAEVVAAGQLVPVEGQVAGSRRLYVRPPYRRQGVARGVAETLIDRAHSLGYRRIVLDVMPERSSALRLWDSLGFLRCPPYRSYPFVMESLGRDLSPP